MCGVGLTQHCNKAVAIRERHELGLECSYRSYAIPKSQKRKGGPEEPPFLFLVGAERFELPTLCSQNRCATRLRYAPTTGELPLVAGIENP